MASQAVDGGDVHEPSAELSAEPAARRDALVERLFEATLGPGTCAGCTSAIAWASTPRSPRTVR